MQKYISTKYTGKLPVIKTVRWILIRILILFFLLLPTLSSGQDVISSEDINEQLKEGIVRVKKKYNFHDDFIKLTTIRYRQEEKGIPELTKNFRTTTLKSNGQAVNPNTELEQIYQELAYLISERPKRIKLILHAPIYDIECSYKGEVIKLRLIEGMGSENLEAKKWVNRLQDLHLKIFQSIVEQAAPNNTQANRAANR